MKNHAFTMTEVLLVIAIIAALGAIIFPMVARSKKTANESVCQQRLRQYHLATTLYRDEWDGVITGSPSQMGLPFDVSQVHKEREFSNCSARVGSTGDELPLNQVKSFIQSWPYLDGFGLEPFVRWGSSDGGPIWHEMLKTLGSQSPMYIDDSHPDRFPVSRHSTNRAFAITFDGNVIRKTRTGEPRDIRFWYR
jgi:prepilin-type N-terminal cleavage/methylation domain-containing protein